MRPPACSVIVLLLCSAPSTAAAQPGSAHDHVAQIIGLITEDDEKRVAEAMAGWEALERVEVSCAAHRIKFSSAQPIDEDQVDQRLAGTGASVFWLATVQADGSLAGGSYELHAFPRFEDTGDPGGDNARYDAAKAAWLAAHPGWVDQNTRPTSPDGTPNEPVK